MNAIEFESGLVDPFQKRKEACERKRTFRLKVHADVHILQELNKPNPPKRLTAYKCVVCGFYHMTSA